MTVGKLGAILFSSEKIAVIHGIPDKRCKSKHKYGDTKQPANLSMNGVPHSFSKRNIIITNHFKKKKIVFSTKPLAKIPSDYATSKTRG